MSECVVGITFVVALAVSLAACDSSNTSTGHNRPERAAYTERQVARVLGLHRDGVAWEDDKQQCEAAVIFTNSDAMEVYIAAGDPVATNPSGTVGAKVISYEGVDPQMCFDRFQTALKRLR